MTGGDIKGPGLNTKGENGPVIHPPVPYTGTSNTHKMRGNLLWLQTYYKNNVSDLLLCASLTLFMTAVFFFFCLFKVQLIRSFPEPQFNQTPDKSLDHVFSASSEMQSVELLQQSDRFAFL